ncbi:MAG: DUF3078 domain-containing protein [Saprospiraceae bacterium]|nr:DUF3078 domain-containing protein [Saprospiraceae bacterium]
MQNTLIKIVKLVFFTFGIITTLVADPSTGSPTVRDTSYWSSKKSTGLFFSQQSFSPYFKGGGISSIALGTVIDINADYKKAKRSWNNRFQLRYGIIKMAELPVQKNDDHLEIDSKYGYQFTPHLKVTGLFNFQTKMHDIYELKKTGERGKRIGNFLAPAYFHLGSGIDYFTKDKWLSIYYSPINSKLTIVADRSLVNQYLPGIEEGRNTKYELGSLLRIEIKKEIMTNISVHTIGSFFTNHLDDFGVFDVNIENKLNFKINKLFSVNLLTQLIYDEDILFDIQSTGAEQPEIIGKGPRTQFKEVLNIGLTHSF